MASKDKKRPKKQEDSGQSEILQRIKKQPFIFIGTIVILVIVIVAFVFVPAIVPNAQRGQSLTFGYYNKKPISYVRDSYFYNVQQSLARSQQPSQDDPNFIFAAYQIWRQAFDETVVYMGVLDEMKRAGYTAPEEVVNRKVAEMDMFKDEKGNFSASRYRSLDKTTSMNIWRQVQESAAVGMYFSDMENIKIPGGETSFVGAMAYPQRSFDYMAFPFDSYPDSEVISYAAANQDLFKTVHLSKISLYSGEREAQQVLNSVKNGVLTFEEAARTSSQDSYAERGGDMGIRMVHELIYEIDNSEAREKIVNMQRGEISDVVSLSNQWAFFRVEESSLPADLNDESQIAKIREYIMINFRGLIEDWLIAEAEKFSLMADEIGFDNAASALYLEKKSFGPVSVNYGNAALFSAISPSDNPELSNAGTNQFFWRAAFSTPLGITSNPVVVGDNIIVLLPLDEITGEEDGSQFIEMYYPYWVNSGIDQTLRQYFLSNEKLDDRFGELFWKIFSF